MSVYIKILHERGLRLLGGANSNVSGFSPLAMIMVMPIAPAI